jgi:hypothetical protein
MVDSPWTIAKVSKISDTLLSSAIQSMDYGS